MEEALTCLFAATKVGPIDHWLKTMVFTNR